jgi:hypothetical protein
VRSGRPLWSSPCVVHCAINIGNASSTGVSLNVAPFVPLSKITSVVQVPTVCEIIDPESPSGFGSLGGIVHRSDTQFASSSALNADVQSDGLNPLRGWEKSLPHTGVPKVTLPSCVGWADVVHANNPAASKIALCDFIV